MQSREGFQSTLPTRGETRRSIWKALSRKISIHSPHTGRDSIIMQVIKNSKISIHSPHTGRDRGGCPMSAHAKISIHSPHTGRDKSPRSSASLLVYFNPLSPHGERPRRRRRRRRTGNFNPLSPHGERRRSRWSAPWPTGFQSTLPAWGETLNRMKDMGFNIISIHSPRMGRDRERAGGRIDVGISIHSPRMGRDEGLRIDADRLNVFQSTLPAWGETSERCTPCRCRPDFNPLSPHGERRGRDSRPLPYSQFQSTLPAWGETGQDPGAAGHHPISIHSPRMGRDLLIMPSARPCWIFQSTLPAWGETS